MKTPKLAAVAAFALLALPLRAADEIHWTITGQTSVTFDWRGSETGLSYGTSPSSYTNTVTATAPVPLPTSSGGPFREATLTGLAENTLYYYAIGSGAQHTFRTPPPRGNSGFTIYVQGDVGSAKAYSRVTAVQKIVANAYGNGWPLFVLVPGDLTYGDSNGADDTDAHFNDVMLWSRDAAYMPAWGNHEWHTSSDDDQLNDYEGRFGLPNSQTSPGASAAIGNGPADDWYWFDYGNVRFIAFPEPYSGAWSDWQTKAKSVMDAAQADSQIAFIVTFGHRPSYSSGPISASSTLKSILDGLGDGHSKYKLDLSGHSHHYERTFAQHGVVHLVVGTGHASPGSFGNTKPSWSAFRTIQSGAVKLAFSASGIEGQFICAPASSVCYADGGVLDDFTIGTPGDSTPPTVALTAPAAGSTVSGTVTVQATASDNSGQVASVQFRLDGQNLGAPDTTAPYSISWNTTAAGNGAHTLSAQATDPAGNVGTSASVNVTVSNADTTAPTVAVTAPAAGSTVSDTVTVSATASDNSGQVASVQFKLDGQNLGAADTAAPYSISWSTAAAANGLHTLSAQATDPSGNVATSDSVSITVSNASTDSTPPIVAVTAPAADATVSGTVTVSASASDDSGQVASVQFKLDGQNLGAADTAAPYSISWSTAATANGLHTLSAQATDPTGNNATASITVTVNNVGDTTPPSVAVTAPAAGSTVSGTTTVTASASDDSGQVAFVQFKLDGQNLGAADTTAPYSVSWNTTQVPNGPHTLSAQATDPTGNNATASITVTVNNVVDTTPPSVAVTAPAAGATVSGSVTVTASASDNSGLVASVQFKLDGQNLGAADTTAPYEIAWDTATTSNGAHTLSAKAKDVAGNGTTASIGVTTANPVLVFTPTADATLTLLAPDTNNGTASTLEVDASPATDAKEFLIKFEVSGLAGHAVTNAKLRLYCVNFSDKGGAFYRVADSSWTETGATWNNAPPADAIPLATLGPVSQSNWYDVDVTPLVTGEGTFSLRAKPLSGDGADYDSREVTGFTPRLVVTYQP